MTDSHDKSKWKRLASWEKAYALRVRQQQHDLGLEINNSCLAKCHDKVPANLNGDPTHEVYLKCCNRCKSDLNGKLMVRCSTCLFCCHLYCFTPPLKQHPAFAIQRRQRASQKDEKSIPPIWKCERCEGTSVVFNIEPRFFSAISRKKQQAIRSLQGHKLNLQGTTISRLTVQAASLGFGENIVLDPRSVPSAHFQWTKATEGRFDWHQFQTRKAKALSCHGPTRCRSKKSVFYSDAYASKKKTATSWRALVMRRRKIQRSHELKTIAQRSLDKSPMSIRQATGQIMLKAAREEVLDEMHMDIVNIDHSVQYLKRRTQYLLLSKDDLPSALTRRTTGEHVEIEKFLREVVERICIASEDHDAFSSEVNCYASFNTASRINQRTKLSDPHFANRKSVNGHVAAYSLCYQLIDRAKRRRFVLEEIRRKVKAQFSITIVCIYVQLIVNLFKLLGRVRTKRAAHVNIKNAVFNERKDLEDKNGEVVGFSLWQRKLKVAQARICRVIERRVCSFSKHKENVSARRLQCFWKHHYYVYKWKRAAIAIRLAYQNNACIRIQLFYRYSRIQHRLRVLLKGVAVRKLQKCLIRWHFKRLETRQCATIEVAQLVATKEASLSQEMCLDNILEKHGLECYYRGDFWNAASLLERLYRIQKGNMTWVLQKTLACSHHMAWYTSCDHFNLTRAYELYYSAFENCTISGEHVDPLVLQDFALVMMHMENFGDSLRLLAKLIESFSRHPHFALWVLLAAVQMQHRGAREQSVEYLMYLHDIPPYPYLEHDILALAAINYEQLAHAALKASRTRDSNRTLAKEAWCAALRLWRLKINSDLESSSANTQSNGRALTSRQKWDLLTNLGNRALEQGHFLLACDVCLYTLKHVDNSEEVKSAMWQNLADGYRHLGHLDLYLRAVIYNQYNVIGEDDLLMWRELMELQACTFQAELNELTALQKLRQLDKNLN